jgi:hypothetical protein
MNTFPQLARRGRSAAEAHLTAEQIDDVLIAGVAELPAPAAAHLAACAPCQESLAAAASPLTSFRDVSLAWAERRSATLPLQPPAAAPARSSTRWTWISASAAALAVGLLIPALRSHEPTQAAAAVTGQALAVIGHTGVTSVTPVAASPEQIQRDNQMLDDIDRALDAPASSASFGLDAASPRSRASVQASERD